MPYVLFECPKNNSGKMDKIWDDAWSASDIKIEEKLRKVGDEELLPVFLKYLPKNDRILEAGCGLGQWVIYLRGKGYDIAGIDFAEETVKAVKKYKHDLPVEFCDVKKTRFDDNYFGAYISLGVVEHFLEGPSEALLEAKRILKKGGLLFVSVPVFNSARRCASYFEKACNFMAANKVMRKLFGKKECPKKHFIEYRYSIREFEKILKDSKFSIIHKFTLQHSPFSMFNYFLETPDFLLKGSFFYKIFDHVARFLKSRSEWIAPHEVMWICSNDKG
jgi:SAM-dependent methyltransferase